MRLRKRVKLIEEEIANLRRDKISYAEIVSCENCGCLVYKKNTVEGQPKLKEHEGLYAGDLHYACRIYYCKRCVPKKKEE